MNLCNYRAQIGLAPHEAALDLLIIVQKRMEKEEARGIKNVGIGWQQFNSFAKNEIAITHRIFMAIARPNKKQEKIQKTNCLIFCLSYRTNTHTRAPAIAYLGPQSTENFHTFSFAPFATLCHKNKLK